MKKNTNNYKETKKSNNSKESCPIFISTALLEQLEKEYAARGELHKLDEILNNL